ncbi:MAG: 50S ribosomal protein L6 [Candidatus Muproteobacteria bacterium RBG_16_64_11]|uniref:Large ribosomal subunit protein uL6 n=1 Tax=Candidatus Muproteobacteria bacterium RBG_16_64_11 TaxID=1817758 RepID=A0A1F6TEQ8_9PROT|nr:MAG: 50S ribosomal protein L6 [Candidatus Muproteobacteria bacterium RBG_16_64_11]
MSRVAKVPVTIPAGVEVKLSGALLSVKGPKGKLEFNVHPQVKLAHEGAQLTVGVQSNAPTASALSGTTRAIISNMVQGAHKGFEKKLTIIGVGYRAAVAGKNLNLTLGYSHAVVYPIPEGITIECPDQTNIVVRGADKQKVGQVAAEIRAYRGPEPYKGKGVRYTDEQVARKEAKKK